MNAMYNPIVFYFSAILIIIFALLAINLKNIFHSLLSAILVFFLAGLLFYILGSEYNAVIQIAIYGIAVPIILGLAVMFTNFKKNDINKKSNTVLKYLTYLTGGIFILATIYLIIVSLAVNPIVFNITDQSGNTTIQVLKTFAESIFTKYVWSFELISIILTIIVVGITLFNNKKTEDK